MRRESLGMREDRQKETVPGKGGRGRKRSRLLVGIAVCVTIAAVAPQLRFSRSENAQLAPQTMAEQTVGVVHPDGKVELRKIIINRDFGNKLEISEGLSTLDQVILNPSDSLTDGMSVTITEPGSLQASSR